MGQFIARALEGEGDSELGCRFGTLVDRHDACGVYSAKKTRGVVRILDGWVQVDGSRRRLEGGGPSLHERERGGGGKGGV